MEGPNAAFWRRLAPALVLATAAVSGGCQTRNPTPVSDLQPIVYRVRVERGDTLAKIAHKYDTSWQSIVALNHLPLVNPLVVGHVLRLTPGPQGLVEHPKLIVCDDFGDGDDEGADEDIAGGLLFGRGSERARLDWPLLGSLTSRYGRRHGRFHHGVDIRAVSGSIVQAAAPGVVEFAGWQRGYGKVVIVRHRNFKTLYAHLAGVKVARGDKVARATEVGLSGKSGHTTGPHLHFEIRRLNGQSVDPMSVMEQAKLLTSRS